MLELYVMRFRLIHALSMSCLYNPCQLLRCCNAQNCCNQNIGMLLLWYRQPLASLPPMPPVRHLLRIFLILALSADGITGAWAATRMAVNQASQAQAQTLAGEKAKPGCETDKVSRRTSAATPAQAPVQMLEHDQDDHEDCDCGDHVSCVCGCMLTFFPVRATTLFAAQHALTSMHLTQPLLPALHPEVSRRFRPPIG